MNTFGFGIVVCEVCVLGVSKIVGHLHWDFGGGESLGIGFGDPEIGLEDRYQSRDVGEREEEN